MADLESECHRIQSENQSMQRYYNRCLASLSERLAVTSARAEAVTGAVKNAAAEDPEKRRFMEQYLQAAAYYLGTPLPPRPASVPLPHHPIIQQFPKGAPAAWFDGMTIISSTAQAATSPSPPTVQSPPSNTGGGDPMSTTTNLTPAAPARLASASPIPLPSLTPPPGVHSASAAPAQPDSASLPSPPAVRNSSLPPPPVVRLSSTADEFSTPEPVPDPQTPMKATSVAADDLPLPPPPARPTAMISTSSVDVLARDTEMVDGSLDDLPLPLPPSRPTASMSTPRASRSGEFKKRALSVVEEGNGEETNLAKKQKML